MLAKFKRLFNKEALGIYLDGDVVECVHLGGESFVIEGPENLRRLLTYEKLREFSAYKATGLRSREVLVRSLQLPLKGKRAILKALPFQAESLLPYDLDEALIAPVIQKKRVTLFASRKSQLKDHLKEYHKFWVHPDLVTTTSRALLSFARHFLPERKNLIILHAGRAGSELIAIEEGEVRVALSLDSLGSELERALFFLKQKNLLADYLITGPGSVDRALLSGEELSVSEEVRRFAIPYGLALELKNEGIQFLTEEFVPLAQLRQIKSGLKKATLMACFFFALTAGSLSLLYKKRISDLNQSLTTLTRAEGSLETKMASAGRQLMKQKGVSHFRQPAPLVSDLLVKLSSHPLLKEGMEVDDIRFELISYPTVDEPGKPYKAKVNFALKSDSPVLADEFIDHLRESEDEVQSSRSQNGYQISFITRSER